MNRAAVFLLVLVSSSAVGAADEPPIAPVRDGYNDPNAIVYDDARFQRFLRDLTDQSQRNVIAEIETPKGIETAALLNREAGFGKKFRQADLEKFLRRRIGRANTVAIPPLPREVARQPGVMVGNDGSPWVDDLRVAFWLLARSRSPAMDSICIGLLNDPSPVLAQRALESLSGHGDWRKDPETVRKVVAAGFDVLRKSKGPNYPMPRLFDDLGEACCSQILDEARGEGPAGYRRSCLYMLATLRERSASAAPGLGAIVRQGARINEKDENLVVDGALIALAHIGPKAKAARADVEAVLDVERLRLLAFCTLVEMGTDGYPAVRRYLKSPSSAVRLSAIEALSGNLRARLISVGFPSRVRDPFDAETLESLLALRNDPDPSVRAQLPWAWQYHPDREKGALLTIALLDDPSPEVIAAAATMLPWKAQNNPAMLAKMIARLDEITRQADAWTPLVPLHFRAKQAAAWVLAVAEAVQRNAHVRRGLRRWVIELWREPPPFNPHRRYQADLTRTIADTRPAASQVQEPFVRVLAARGPDGAYARQMAVSALSSILKERPPASVLDALKVAAKDDRDPSIRQTAKAILDRFGGP